MKKANFWLVQIALVAIVSLAFGSPVFAGAGDNVTAVEKRAGNGLSANASGDNQASNSNGAAQGWSEVTVPGDDLPDFFKATDTNGDRTITDEDCPDGYHLFSEYCVID